MDCRVKPGNDEGARVPGAVQRFFSGAPQSRDRTKRRRSLRPRLCNAPLRKGYALRCVRGTRLHFTASTWNSPSALMPAS